MLNATIVSGPAAGQRQDLCAFPLRPLWDAAGTLNCVFDQASFDTWVPNLSSIPLPVY